MGLRISEKYGSDDHYSSSAYWIYVPVSLNAACLVTFGAAG